jgi:hypothetical protein
MPKRKPRLCLIAAVLLLAAGPAAAQKVISLEPQGGPAASGVTAPSSVGNGIANGVVKPAGAPSVGDGRANGVVKRSGAPSVGDGVANGVVKSTTVNQ